TAGKNLTDVSLFTEEFSRMFKDDVADFMSDGKYSAALKTVQKLERRFAEVKRRVAEEKRRFAEEKRRFAEEKRRFAEARTARLEAEKRVRELEEAAAFSKQGRTGPGGGPDK
ncbi:MAG: hypothetical protein LBW85_13490, partial [Deltaproteobacteria bacterium]|nr:hypothetical protein [Deltaproteobacteria bacterium]